MGQTDGASTLSEDQWKIIDATEYYLSIGCRWCFIEKQMSKKQVELEHLLALGRSQRDMRRNDNA